MIKKVLSIFLVVLMLAVVPLGVSAETVQPRYAHVTRHSTTLSISNDVANITSQVIGDNDVTSIKMTLVLQKKTVLWWSDVAEFSDIAPRTSLTMIESYAVGSGKYRVKMTARVCFGSGPNYEDIEGYSAEKSN